MKTNSNHERHRRPAEVQVASWLLITALICLQVAAAAQQQQQLATVTATTGSQRTTRQVTAASAAPQVTPQPLLVEPSSVNLIPVDQPIVHKPSEFHEPVIDSGEPDQAAVEEAALAEGPIELRQQQQVDNAAATAHDRKHQQQAVESLFALNQTPEQQFKHQVSLQQQQQVERRFGFMKKGQQQQQQPYGSPMTANYATSPYLSDCERCLASLGQQSADLQQIDPMTPIAPVAPITPPLPPQPAPLPAPQPFGPLKNKLFMKFPFFLKPISFPDTGGYGSGGSHGDAVPYWHQYQPMPMAPRPPPVSGAALYLRPAYNCIQATPSQLHQDVVTSGSNSGQTKGTGSKQFAHQQTYSSSQY